MPRVDKLEEYILAMSVGITKLSNEMRDFKDEMKVQWGNLANRLGRVVEDLIIPNIDDLIDKYFEEKVHDYYEGLYKRKEKGQEGKQFGGIVTTENYVFFFEIKTKSLKNIRTNFVLLSIPETSLNISVNTKGKN